MQGGMTEAPLSSHDETPMTKDSLTTNENSFIEMMAKSDEHASKGFELVLKRPDFPRFIDAMIEKGFFDPSRNPAPAPADRDGYVYIPYWNALDYLKACAKFAGRENDTELAEKIMTQVRSVSRASKSLDSRDNHYTFWVFAEIVGLLPISSITSQDLDLVQVWLNTKYDRSLVPDALDRGLLSRFVACDDPDAWRGAVRLMCYCTAIRWKPAALHSDEEEPITVADDYYVKEMIEHHATSLGRKVGYEAAKLFAARVAEVFGRGGRAKWSQVFRPAVEDDHQNSQGYEADDCVVEGLRDVLLGWCESDPCSAKLFVQSLLRNRNEMLRRIGIFVLRQHWIHLRCLYLPVVSTDLFNVGHLHELYLLLRDRFDTFSDAEKEATINSIRNLSDPGPDGSGARQRIQYLWLSALAGTTDDSVSKWLSELTRKYGAPPKHPEFLSYTETRWGPGPSQYNARDLIAFADDGSIVEKLREFRPGDPWHGPTSDALVEELQRAITAAPDRFVNVMPDFLKAPRQYQHGLLRGFLRLFRDSTEGITKDTRVALWHSLFDYFEQLLKDTQLCWRDDSSPVDLQPSWNKRTALVPEMSMDQA